jgi:hypothetical protein
MRGAAGRDFEGYRVLYGKELVVDNWRHYLTMVTETAVFLIKLKSIIAMSNSENNMSSRRRR